MKRRKIWRRAIVFVASAVFVLSLFACTGQKETEKETVQTRKEMGRDHRYRLSLHGLGIKASSVLQLCEKDNRVFMLVVKGKKTFLVTCDLDGSDAGQIKLGLGSGEIAGNLALDGEKQFRVLTLEEKKSGTVCYIKTVDEKGNILESHELKQKKTEKGSLFPNRNTSVIADDGSVYMLAGNQHVILFDPDGNEGGRVDCKSYITSLVRGADGSVYACGNGTDGYEWKKLDMEKGNVSGKVCFGEYQVLDGNIYCGTGSAFYLVDQKGVSLLELSNGTIEKLFAWADQGIDGMEIVGGLPIERGDVFAVSISSDENTGEITAVIAENSEDSGKEKETSEKKILTLACARINTGKLQENILKFNQQNEMYQIQVNDYSEYEDPWTQLNLDIVSGKIPDIFCLSGLPVDLYVKKGILADLYPLMDQDGEISREDFVDSIRTAVEMDGRLYYLGAAFSLEDCLIIGKKYVGGREGWCIDEMEELYQEMPEDGVFINEMTRQLFIRKMVFNRIEDYVDEESGKVSFDSEGFRKILEFARYFQDEKELIPGSVENPAIEIAEGKLMIYDTRILDLTRISFYNTLFQKDGGYQVVSYPAEDKSNRLSISFSDPAMGISEQCQDKEGAWEFLREFFTYDYGMAVSTLWFLPTRKDVLEKRLSHATATETYTDSDGTMVTPIGGSMGFMDYSAEIHPFSEEDVAFVRSLIARIGKVSNESDDMQLAVLDIVQTEAESYFAGDKTAEETAEIIQNRVQLYVNENS